jgi:hypothetical protein
LADWLVYGIVIGMAAVGLAIFDRGYGAYRTAKKDNPDLKFSADYLVNIIVSAGGMGGLFAGVFPLVVNSIAQPKEGTEIIWFGLQFISGYLATLGLLDKLNRVTEKSTEAAVFKKLATDAGAVTIDNKSKAEADISKVGGSF